MSCAPDPAPDSCVRHVFTGSGYVIGEFRCPPGTERWRTENWIGRRSHVVIPGTPVLIVPAGADAHLSTANEVLVYDPDVLYRRRLVSSDGDRCRFLVLDDELAAELALSAAAPRVSGPRLRYCPLASTQYTAYRLLCARAGRPGVNPLAVDEAALGLLEGTAARVAADGRTAGRIPPVERTRREAVETVTAILATRLDESFTLAQLANAVHYSPYWLARTFRRHTGYPIHVFQRQLRLRASLDRVLDPTVGLTDVAARYGFASHSHYTYAFRRAFGCPPSEVRRAAAAGQVLST